MGGVSLFRENVSYLLGRAPPEDALARVEAANDVAEEVTRQVVALSAGPNLVTVHVDPERPRAPGRPTAGG